MFFNVDFCFLKKKIGFPLEETKVGSIQGDLVWDRKNVDFIIRRKST